VSVGFESRPWHPDAEHINARGDPEPATHRGLRAIASVFESWVEAYPDLRVEPLEIRSEGDRAFAWVRFSGHGAGSGLAMHMR